MADDQGKILVYSFVGFILGLFLFIKGFLWLKQKRLIENIPTSKVRSIAMGLVEIYGEAVKAKKLLKSPFSNKDCVYYRYTIEEYRSSGKSRRWVTIKKAEDGTPFYLRDNTGSVLVDPIGAHVDIPRDNQFRSGFGQDPSLMVQKFLKINGLNFEGLLGTNKSMRYTEYFIAPKDKVYIMGTADDNPFVEEASAQNSVEDIMIQKGKNEKFYYISDKPEKEILKKFKWKVIGGIFGGSIISIGCLAIILAILGLF